MALIQVNYCSKALFRTVPLNVILPADRFDADTDRYLQEEACRYKTLYLLHGLLGYYNDWVSFTRIQKWAEEKNLAVVMPSGDNAFYFRCGTRQNVLFPLHKNNVIPHRPYCVKLCLRAVPCSRNQ